MITAVFIMVAVSSMTGQPLPYDGTIGGGEGTNPVGGGAPLDGGLLLMVSYGLGYIALKFRRNLRK